MINLDIAPSLQNIQNRIQGNNPIDAYYKGAQQGFQQTVQQNQLSQIARENQARPLAGAALTGDPRIGRWSQQKWLDKRSSGWHWNRVQTIAKCLARD